MPEIREPEAAAAPPRKKDSVPEIAVQEPAAEEPRRMQVPIVKEPTPEPDRKDSLAPDRRGSGLEPGSPGGSRRGSLIITADEVC